MLLWIHKLFWTTIMLFMQTHRAFNGFYCLLLCGVNVYVKLFWSILWVFRFCYMFNDPSRNAHIARGTLMFLHTAIETPKLRRLCFSKSKYDMLLELSKLWITLVRLMTLRVWGLQLVYLLTSVAAFTLHHFLLWLVMGPSGNIATLKKSQSGCRYYLYFDHRLFYSAFNVRYSTNSNNLVIDGYGSANNSPSARRSISLFVRSVVSNKVRVTWYPSVCDFLLFRRTQGFHVGDAHSVTVTCVVESCCWFACWWWRCLSPIMSFLSPILSFLVPTLLPFSLPFLLRMLYIRSKIALEVLSPTHKCFC